MYYIKIHKKSDTAITAICDEGLIGKKFEDSERQLDVSERFYKDKLIDEEEAVNELKDAEILNITGKKIVELAIKNNIIKKENVIYIKKKPHAESC